MMHIKNIFIYNAGLKDQVEVNGTVVKRRGQPFQDVPEYMEKGLRILFQDNIEDARAQGVFERLDSAFLDLNLLHNFEQPVNIQIYGRSQNVKLEIS